jgi:hypothetical protein
MDVFDIRYDISKQIESECLEIGLFGPSGRKARDSAIHIPQFFPSLDLCKDTIVVFDHPKLNAAGILLALKMRCDVHKDLLTGQLEGR